MVVVVKLLTGMLDVDVVVVVLLQPVADTKSKVAMIIP
jgi:hypothetical protein